MQHSQTLLKGGFGWDRFKSRESGEGERLMSRWSGSRLSLSSSSYCTRQTLDATSYIMISREYRSRHNQSWSLALCVRRSPVERVAVFYNDWNPISVPGKQRFLFLWVGCAPGESWD